MKRFVVRSLAPWLVLSLLALGTWLLLRTFEASKATIAWSIAALELVAIVLWKVPQWQVAHLTDPGQRFELENAARKTVAQLAGGVFLLAGFYATWQNLAIARRSESLSEQNQLSERLNKASEQMGAQDPIGRKNMAVRLRGIAALEAIANESPENRQQIVDTLTAYLRHNALRGQEKDCDNTSTNPSVPRLPEDYQAVLKVLNNRKRRDAAPYMLYLDHIDLRGADLRDMNLEGAYMSGTNLSGADVRGGVLRGAFLSGACLMRATLRGTDLRGAHFRQAILNGALLGYDPHLRRSTDLSGADNLLQEQIDSTHGDFSTILDPGFKRGKMWTPEFAIP